MASSGKQLNVKMNFQVDTTQAQQQLKNLSYQLNQIVNTSASGNNQLGITSQILQATKAAAQLKATLAEAVNPLTGNLDLARFNDQLRLSGMSLTKYRDAFSALGTSGNATFNQLARSISTAEIPMLRLGKAAQTMWTVLGNTVRWQATSSILHGIMSTASQAMGYVKSLDTSLNNIRIVTGQSQEQMARFAKTANQAAKELNTSTNEYAKASLIYYQQGLSNKQVEERTRTTIKLANVAGQSAKTVSDQLTAVWNNFYDGSKSLEYYADVITALGASTASSSEEIAKGLQKFSSIAQTTGLSYEYATSALSTVVAATRQSADSVGTSFKTLFSRLQGLSLGETLDDGTTLNKYSQALNTVGINIKKANGELKSMDDILDEIGAKWQGLSQDTKVALAQTVGGVRNYTGLMSLMDHWGEFQTNLKTAQNAQGTLQHQADIYAESWQAASAHVKAASETIYKNLLDDKFFKGLTNGFGTVLDVIGEMTNQLGGFRGGIATAVNLATNLFRPQISQGLANLGSSIYGLSKTGYQELVNLRISARNEVGRNLRFSQYDSVDQLTKQYNQNFNERQEKYEAAVRQGRISQAQQPVYQMLLNNMAQSEQRNIQAAEQSAKRQGEYSTEIFKSQANLNSIIQARQQELRDKFNPNGPNRAMVEAFTRQNKDGTIGDSKYISKHQTDYREFLAYRDYISGKSNQELFSIQNLRPAINAYNAQVATETAVKDLKGILERPDNVGVSSLTALKTDDLRYVAQHFQNLALGAQEGQDLDTIIPGLGQFQKALKGRDISTLSRKSLRTLLGKSLGQNAFTALNNLLSGEAGSAQTARDIETSIRTNLGYSIDDASKSAAVTEMRKILTNTELSEKEKIERLQDQGLTKSQSLGLIKDMDNQVNPKTVQMSGALTSVAGAAAAAANTITSVSNAVKTFGDENATATQKIASMGSVAMSMSMLTPQIANFAEHMKDTVKIFDHSTGMTMGQMGLYGVLAAASIWGISKIVQDRQANSREGSIKRLGTMQATGQQIYSNLQQQSEQLGAMQQSYYTNTGNLKTSLRGSEEYYNNLTNALSVAQNIIDEYDLEYEKDYTFDNNGIPVIAEETFKRVAKEKQQEAFNASLTNLQLGYAERLFSAYTDGLGQFEEKTIDLVRGNNVNENAVSVANVVKYFDNLFASNTLPLEDLIDPDKLALFRSNRTTDDDIREFIWDRTVPEETRRKYIQQILTEGHSTALLPMGSPYLTMEGQKFSIDSLKTVTGINDENALVDMLLDMSQRPTKDRADYYTRTYGDVARAQLNGAVMGFANASAQKLDNSVLNKEFIGQLFGQQLIANPEAMEAIATFVTKASNKDTFENMLGLGIGGMTPEKYYEAITHSKVDKDWTEDEIAWRTAQAILTEGLADTSLFSKYIHDKDIDFSSIKGLNVLQKELEELQLPILANYNLEQINALLDKKREQFANDPDKIALLDAIGQQFSNQVSDLYTDIGQALLVHFKDGTLDGEIDSESLRATTFELAKDLNKSSLQFVADSLIQANTLGKNTSWAVQELLMNGREGTSISKDTSDIISKFFSFDNNLGGIYQSTQYMRYLKKQEDRDKYQNLLLAQIKDIDNEKGFFNMLYKSSGFDDVMNSLSSLFNETGHITAANIEQIASKQEELNYLLGIGKENLEGATINSAGLANIFENLLNNTLTQQGITSSLISSLSIAGQGRALDQQALNDIQNLNLGTSGTDFLTGFQTMGKEWYSLEKAGWGFNSESMGNIINQLGNSEIKKAYYEANRSKTNNFTTLKSQLPTYFIDFLDTMAGKKGKGGGGPADLFTFLYNSLTNGGTELISDEEWNKMGFKIGKNGSLEIGAGLTQEDFIKILTDRLVAKGYNQDSAAAMARQAAATAHSSGNIGANMDDAAAQLGLQTLLGYELNQEAADILRTESGGNLDLSRASLYKRAKQKSIVTDEGLETFFNANRGYFGDIDFEEFKTQFLNGGFNLAGANGTNYTYLQTNADYFQTHAGATDLQGIMGTQGKTYTSDSIDQNNRKAFHDFTQLASDFGAITENGTWDYNKMVELLETMGGSTANVNEIIQEYLKDFQGKLVGRDANGNEILFGSDDYINWVDFQKALDNGISTRQYIENTLAGDTTGQSIYNAYQSMYYKNEKGEWELDLDGSKRAAAQENITYNKQYDEWQNSTIAERYGLVNRLSQQVREKGVASLTPFERQLLIEVGEIKESTGELVTYSEESKEDREARDEKRRNAVEGKGEGEDLDNDGKVDLPYNAPNKNSAGDRNSSKSSETTFTFSGLDENNNRTYFGSDGLTYTIDQEGNVTNNSDDLEKLKGAASAGKKASGQNNHTLSFASGSKGEIAVTGELGPELRIKEDGSADLLGKKGREYAWVNPGDRIYTATQTASILGSNNIPLLDGLAKGIRNHIPGYGGSTTINGVTYSLNSSTQGGGSTNREAGSYNLMQAAKAAEADWNKNGGYYAGAKKKKTDPRYDPNTLKARDVIERYYTILQQIDDITRAVEHFAAVADRAWGKDRIKAINEQIKMEEKQIEAQKRYLAEIQNNLKVDKAALTTMITDFIKEYKKAGLGDLPTSGIEFDENGVITNYTTIMQGFVDAYNKNPLAHAADKKYQYKFQERLKDIQMYTESLNLLEEQEEQLLNLQNQLFDTKLQKIQVELEYKTSLVDDDLNLLSYQLGKVKDNAFLAAEAVDIMGQQYDASIKKLELQQDALRDLFALHLPDFANTSYNLTQEESELTKQLQNLEDLRAVFDNDNKEINRGKKAKIKGEDKANYTDEEKAFLESLGLYYLDENKKKHYIDDYYSSIETLYKDMYSRYSDKLPNPEDFFVYKDIKVGDKTKTYLLNYADVLQKLVDLNNQLTKNDILQEFDENGNLTNAEEVSEKVAKLYEELKERMPDVDIELKWNEENSKILDNYREVLDAINKANSQLFDNSAIGDMFENGDWWKAFIDDGANFFDMLSSLPGYTDLTAQEVETLRNTISAMLGELKSMQEAYENMFDTLGDTIKTYGKELNTQIGYFDHYEKIISSYKNILDLTGRNTLEISRQITNTMMSKSVDNAINKLKGAKAAYEAMAATVADTSQRLAKAEADYLKNQNSETTATLDLARQTYQNALSQYHDMEESYMQAWEDALQRAQDAFQTVVAAATKNFEASFSPMYTSLEQLSNAFNREKELQELYVRDYQRIHDLNKLMRDLDQAIIDTDNITGKEKLRDLLEEITDLQESGVELSEYDLDILQKRFDLELARQNLEDARDAKSLVRLARDNNGNWGYVYTANEDDVAEAEQKYEDAILAMEQANEEYVMNLSGLLDNLFSDTKNQMESLSLASFNYDTEAYLREITKIADAAMTEATFYGDQLTNALGNNSDLMQAVINSFQGSLGNLTTSLGDTLLGSLLTVDNPEALKDLIADNINTLVSDIVAGTGLFDPINDVYEAIDKDVGSIGDEIEDQMEKIGDSSKENLTDTLTLVDRITTAFDSLTVTLDNLIAKMTSPEAKDMIKAYENIVEQLNKFIEGTANYLPENQESIAFEKGVEDWDTFNTILEALKKNGNISVKTMEMNENGEYGLVTRSAEQVLQMMPEWRRMLGENTIYTAEKLASMTLDDYNQLVDTYMNGNKIFKFHINNASDRKKLGAEFGLDEEGNLLVDTTTPEGKAEAQRLLEWLQVNGKKIRKGFKNQNLTDISTLHAQGGLEYNTGWSWLDGTLREPELVLNAGETKDFLKAVDILRTIDLNAKAMSNGYGSLGISGINTIPGVLEQEVTIHAEFPNAVDHYEIEQAFDNLVNKASQYANRK